MGTLNTSTDSVKLVLDSLKVAKDTLVASPYEALSTTQRNLFTDTTALVIIIIFGIVLGLLLYLVFISYQLKKELKKSRQSNNDEIKELIIQLDSKISKALEDKETKTDLYDSLEQCQIENERLYSEIEALKAIKQEGKPKNTTEDENLIIRFFVQKHISVSAEDFARISKSGNQWLEEYNNLPIVNKDIKLSFYLLLKGIIEQTKRFNQDKQFLNKVFERYESFIQNPGRLNVKDEKDRLLFLKNSLELSVIFRDYIRNRRENNLIQTGNAGHDNFEMMNNGLHVQQMSAEQNNQQFDGRNIPSNLLSYSLFCLHYGITDLDVLISENKIQYQIK
ncbi:MAG: hypothetical protein LBU22_03305 [Dysgonamonadaceae bacterium]|jgi:uncharacterized protein YneF (UPF0154 family)|nr:hypothetical protein [Dysgonamonadaceae bacterium]